MVAEKAHKLMRKLALSVRLANETGQTSEIEPGIKDEDWWQQHLQYRLPLGSDDSNKCMTQKYMVEKKSNYSGWDFE